MGEDESRLRQLDALIDEGRRAERVEAERREAETRRQAEIDAKKTYTLDELEEKRAKLAAEIALRITHLNTSEEDELLRRRAERVRGDIADLEAKVLAARAELATLLQGM